MTREDKVIRMSENLDLRPSTAAIAVEMLDKQKEFLMALAENEYDSGFSKAIDRVLDIIDAEAWSYCDYVIKHENGNANKQSAACHLSENIRNAVMALKGGDKE